MTFPGMAWLVTSCAITIIARNIDLPMAYLKNVTPLVTCIDPAASHCLGN